MHQSKNYCLNLNFIAIIFISLILRSYEMTPSLQPHQQVMVDPRTGQLIESDSLGHALADAMNPEDL